MLSPEKVNEGSKDELIRFMKIEFNKRIDRTKKAEAYYYKSTTTEADIERTSGTLELIIAELSKIGNEIEAVTGEKIGPDIAVDGFNEVR